MIQKLFSSQLSFKSDDKKFDSLKFYKVAIRDMQKTRYIRQAIESQSENFG